MVVVEMMVMVMVPVFFSSSAHKERDLFIFRFFFHFLICLGDTALPSSRPKSEQQQQQPIWKSYTERHAWCQMAGHQGMLRMYGDGVPPHTALLAALFFCSYCQTEKVSRLTSS